MVGKDVVDSYGVFADEAPSSFVTHLAFAYPSILASLIVLSTVALFVGVVRIAFKTRMKGRVLMLVGLLLITFTAIHQFTSFPWLPQSMLDALLPNLLFATGASLLAAGFFRLAWHLPAALNHGKDA